MAKTRRTRKPAKKPTRKIAILGTTPSRMQGPIAEDSGWEIWTIGPGGKDTHRWDRLFEIHRTWPEGFKEYLDDLAKVKAPQRVISLVPIPNCEVNTVLNREYLFEKYTREFFSSSISYAIIMAIEEGCTDIGLWGIDLESGEEYVAQRVGCKVFLLLARLAGINVHLPKDCGLLRDPTPYPDRYENLLALTTEKKKDWLTKAIDQLAPEVTQQHMENARQEGRIIIMRAMKADHSAPEEVQKQIDEAERVLTHNRVAAGQREANLNQLRGELGATEFYRRMFVYNTVDPDERALLNEVKIAPLNEVKVASSGLEEQGLPDEIISAIEDLDTNVPS